MKLYWQLTKYLRQRSPTVVIAKGGIVAAGTYDIGFVHPGTDGQVPMYDTGSLLGITPGTMTGGGGGGGATNFDLIAPAATAMGQLIIYSGSTWAAQEAPPADEMMIQSDNAKPLGWAFVAVCLNNLPTQAEKLALDGFPSSPSPSGTNRYLVEDAVGNLVQAYDADLDGLAAMTQTGLVVRTGAGAFTPNRILNPGSGIDITFQSGVAGNPTIHLGVASTTGGSGGDFGIVKVKSADEGKVSDVTAAADADLNIGTIPAGIWDIEAGVLYSSSTAGDFRLTIDHTVVAGITMGWIYMPLDEIAPRVRNVNLNLATNSPTAAFPNQARFAAIRGQLIVSVGLTGDLFIKWAQFTSNAAAATLHRGSWLRVTPLLLY